MRVSKTIKLLEENTHNLHDLGLGSDFFDTMPKAQGIIEKIGT